MNEFESAYKRLNNAQKLAVDTIYGPVMVVAGPGTGKTQILSLRIANILKETDTDPSNILCLTFTEAGVKAMKDRLRTFIGNDSYKVGIYTFHSFTNEIIQANPDYFKFTRELKQIDKLTQIKLVREIIDSLEESEKEYTLIPFYDKYAKVSEILGSISNLKLENISVQNLKDRNETLKSEHEENVTLNSRGKNKGKPTTAWQKYKSKLETVDEFIEIYELYHNAMRTRGFYDFNDMILFVIEAFEENIELLSDYREKYQFIHVDEFQDTNGAQNAIISLLGDSDPEKQPNIFIVGDDDQAIYRFQGANLDNILSFNDRFNNVTVIPTLVNYRSTQTILDIAESLIENNENRLSNKIEDLIKSLQSFFSNQNNDKGASAEVWKFNNADEEIIFLAKEVQKLIEDGVKPEEIAILYRKHAHAEDIAELLHKFDIETDIAVSANAFEHEFIAKILKIMQLIVLYSKDQDELLYKVLLFDFLNIEPTCIYKLAVKARASRENFFSFVLAYTNNEENPLELEEESLNKIVRFMELLFSWHQLSANTSLIKVLESILTELSILPTLNKSDSDFESVLALNSFFSYIQKRQSIEKDLTIERFLNELELVEQNNIKITLPKVTKKGAVNLLTAHSSKGLEFEYVFLIKATSNNWGKTRANRQIVPEELINTDFDKENEKMLKSEDERRLFFVALTRARKQIYITYAEEYFDLNGNTTKANPSQFIYEISDDHLIYKTTIHEDNREPDLVLNTQDYITRFKQTDTTDYSETEKNYLLERISNFSLSPSALNAYLRSPEEFKFSYLLSIPSVASKHLVLGTAIHEALELYNKSALSGKEASLESMLQVLHKSLKRDFEFDEEFERTIEEGEKLLSEYYEEKLKNADNSNLTDVEYNFGYHNIYLPLPEGDPVKLSGRLDAIEYVDKEQNEVKVIDYKTGSAKTEGQIKGTTSTETGDIWRQLVFYKLMGDLDPSFKKDNKTTTLPYIIKQAEVRFIKKKDNKKYITQSFVVSNADVEELKVLIELVMQKIRNLEFPEKTDIEL